MLRAFKKMDDSGDGYVSQGELEKALTTVSTRQPACLHTGFWFKPLLNCCKIFRGALETPHRSQYNVRFDFIFQRGEKMSPEEVRAIFSLLDINEDGKLNYSEVSLC